MEKLFAMPFASVYPAYVAKVVRKGRTEAEVRDVVCWLTGFDSLTLDQHLAARTSLEGFFGAAHLNPAASLITGTICGVRIEHIDDPLMKQIRYLDKLVDEIAKGRPMTKILRSTVSE
jgi:hypothetical protein